MFHWAQKIPIIKIQIILNSIAEMIELFESLSLTNRKPGETNKSSFQKTKLARADFLGGTVSAEKVPIKLLAKQQKQGAAADDGILVPLGVTIMELGEDTLNDRLYDQPMDFNDQIGAKHLNERIREIVQPLRALHKVAMHLDVKPMNFLYTKNESAAGELLKLIDFDGAELLPKGTICKEPEFKLGTTVYASPEYFMRCSKMSTKSDIWSLGVIVYEMLLAQPHIGLYNKANQPAANQHNKFLRDFADLYKGFSYDKAEKEFSYSSNDLDWLDGHIELIELLVRLWNEQHPRIALLLTGLLSYQFGARPSADAVLDFIGEEDQSCYLEFVRNVNDGSLMLFNGVSAVMLGQLLEQRIEELDPSKNVWLMSLDVLPDKSDMERQYFQQILAKLNGAIEAMNAEDKRLRDGGRKCGQSME
uniref:Protein kinase domain-containing protein n=1 Tax=Globodera rostochiensis TaxID=31243 RepID=A0A914IA87_GLORO